jgi:hypothetical protein
MKKLMMLALMLVGSALWLPHANAGAALEQALEGSCARATCTIQHNDGGDITVFQQAAREVLREGKRLVIDGYCASACVILADIARANTCITGNAALAVHQSFTSHVAVVGGRAVPVGPPIRRDDPPQSADINAWVRAHGGYPSSGVMFIPVSAAQQFWKVCR